METKNIRPRVSAPKAVLSLKRMPSEKGLQERQIEAGRRSNLHLHPVYGVAGNGEKRCQTAIASQGWGDQKQQNTSGRRLHPCGIQRQEGLYNKF